MSEQIQKFKNHLIWLLVILGFFSLLYYGISNYFQSPKIETVTTPARNISDRNKQDVQFKKSKNKLKTY
jgi:hypothetical protein